MFTAQYTKSTDLSEEIVQDLFLKIWNDREHWCPKVSVKSYLYTSARNLALDYLKHERVVEIWKQEALYRGTDAPARPDEKLHRHQLRRAVHEAIEDLPERCKHVFQLSRQLGLTYHEIATVLSISEKTVESHMRRAFIHLRECLASYAMPASLERE